MLASVCLSAKPSTLTFVTEHLPFHSVPIPNFPALVIRYCLAHEPLCVLSPSAINVCSSLISVLWFPLTLQAETRLACLLLPPYWLLQSDSNASADQGEVVVA